MWHRAAVLLGMVVNEVHVIRRSRFGLAAALRRGLGVNVLGRRALSTSMMLQGVDAVVGEWARWLTEGPVATTVDVDRRLCQAAFQRRRRHVMGGSDGSSALAGDRRLRRFGAAM